MCSYGAQIFPIVVLVSVGSTCHVALISKGQLFLSFNASIKCYTNPYLKFQFMCGVPFHPKDFQYK